MVILALVRDKAQVLPAPCPRDIVHSWGRLSGEEQVAWIHKLASHTHPFCPSLPVCTRIATYPCPLLPPSPCRACRLRWQAIVLRSFRPSQHRRQSWRRPSIAQPLAGGTVLRAHARGLPPMGRLRPPARRPHCRADVRRGADTPPPVAPLASMQPLGPPTRRPGLRCPRSTASPRAMWSTRSLWSPGSDCREAAQLSLQLRARGVLGRGSHIMLCGLDIGMPGRRSPFVESDSSEASRVQVLCQEGAETLCRIGSLVPIAIPCARTPSPNEPSSRDAQMLAQAPAAEQRTPPVRRNMGVVSEFVLSKAATCARAQGGRVGAGARTCGRLG